MFNLEKEIKKWKISLRKNQSLEDGYIAELESHLRDEIEQKVALGESEEAAFNEAKNSIGNSENLAGEYFKSDTISISGRPPWETPFWMPELVWNYVKVALRNIKRHKGYSFINIVGLSLGIACVLIISLMINYELSYDDFHEKKDRIYRVYTEINRPSGTMKMAPVMFPLAPEAKNIPEIEHAVRISESTKSVAYSEKIFFERISFADPEYLDVFTIELKSGNKNSVLKNPNSIIISEKIALKYFGERDPVGESFKIDNATLYNITGVFKDYPENSHKRMNLIASISSLNENNYARFSKWTSFGNDYTYILIKPGMDPKVARDKIENLVDSKLQEEWKQRYEMQIQPLKDIHFSTFLTYEFAKVIPVAYLYVFGTIAIFILIIACINFINLSTARSAKRNKEVGIRKVVGAGKFQLVKQFLSESFILTFISFLLALVIIYVIIPEVNNLVKTNILISDLLNWKFALIIFAVLFLTSLIAGGYPAFIIASVKPALVLKNSLIKSNKGYSLRSLLVIFQFAIASFLIIGTFTVFDQLDYMLNKELGFNKDEIIVLSIDDEELMKNPEPFKRSLLNNSSISGLTFASGSPASGSSWTDNIKPVDKIDDEKLHTQVLVVDYDFFKTFGIDIISGRSFSKNFLTDENEAMIINQTAAKKLGLQNPIGTKIEYWGDKVASVVGIVEDIHYGSLREEIWPVIFILNPTGNKYLSIKINTANSTETIDFIKEKLGEFSPGFPFDFYFMNEEFEKFYKAEMSIGKLLTYSTFFAILISCIGMLGLVSFLTEQKSKEIGVRKVLGASAGTIVTILSKQFIKWVIIANIIVIPLAFYFAEYWLDNFAYRTEVNYYIFITTIVVSIFITLATVAYHSLKAALSNPVNSLKYE